jgi:hypothetical protein
MKLYVRLVFPSLPSLKSIQGCVFHWTQAIWRKVQAVGLTTPYQKPVFKDVCSIGRKLGHKIAVRATPIQNNLSARLIFSSLPSGLL